jgi:hypothetical protein
VRFGIVGPITEIETIASGPGIRVLGYLRKRVATVRLPNGALRRVELHWYEAHGIGRRDMKIKCYLDVP